MDVFVTEAQLDQLAEAGDIERDNLRSYSGRGMGDNTCLAIVSDDAEEDLFKLGMAFGKITEPWADDLFDELVFKGAMADSLGRDKTVFYWRGIGIKEGD